MASSKKHPFWKIVFSEMIKNKEKKFYQVHHLYIMQSTGPSLITVCYNKYKNNKYNDIYTLPKNIFNPCNLCEKKCKIKNKTYCYTVNAGSWNNLDSKIINFIYCNFKIIILVFIIIIITISINK